MKFFDAYIKLQSEEYQGYLNKGEIFYEQKKYSEALAEFTKAVERKSNEATCYFNQGNAYKQLN